MPRGHRHAASSKFAVWGRGRSAPLERRGDLGRPRARPKETPYRAEDWSLLSAFAQITTVAFESAAKHRTIEALNQDLQAKVEKIAEQQRRILALQTQLHRQTTAEKPPRPFSSQAGRDGAPAPNVAGIVGSSPW